MSKKIKTAIGISSLIVSSILLYRIVSAVWFWIGWEVLGAVLVVYGCRGELVLEKSELDTLGKDEKHRRHLRSLRYIRSVVCGVTMECIGLGHSIPEARKQETVIVSLQNSNAWVWQTNLQLQIHLGELQKALHEAAADRIFADQGGAVGRLKQFAGTKVAIISQSKDRETVRCAGQIGWVLCEAGWDVDGGGEYSSKIRVRGYGSGNSITLPNPSDILVEQCFLLAHSGDGVHVLSSFDDFAQRCAASELVSELLTTHIVSKSESLSPNDSDRVIVVVKSKPSLDSLETFWKDIEPFQRKSVETLRMMKPPPDWQTSVMSERAKLRPLLLCTNWQIHVGPPVSELVPFSNVVAVIAVEPSNESLNLANSIAQNLANSGWKVQPYRGEQWLFLSNPGPVVRIQSNLAPNPMAHDLEGMNLLSQKAGDAVISVLRNQFFVSANGFPGSFRQPPGTLGIVVGSKSNPQ